MGPAVTGTWRKSSRSTNGACVEVAQAGTDVLMRDSKTTGSRVLAFGAASWNAFLDGIRGGEFDQS